MGTICLSSATILRCSTFTRIQNAVLIIPTALEVIFSTSLLFNNWGAGRRHWLLTVEGWIYLTLAAVELLSHMLPAARNEVSVYRSFDLALGILSFLPILLYTLYLYLFTRAELLTSVPNRIRNVAKLMLIIFIPAIIILNEISSLVGVTIGKRLINGSLMLVVGFADKKAETLWTFFTSLTLALFTAYQATVFGFAFYRLILALLNQRKIEKDSMDAAHLFKGLGWINAGIKLGAIETVIGFAGGDFGAALTRRILRFLARAFICIGLVKGLDEEEDFRAVRQELSSADRKNFRHSRLRQFISNPRFSTFRQLSPTATGFHSSHRGQGNLTYGQMDEKGLSEKAGQRVTVQYERGPPTLHMRLSPFDLPSTEALVQSIKSRPPSEWLSYKPPSIRNSAYRNSSVDSVSLIDQAEIVTAPRRTFSQKSARAQVYQAPVPTAPSSPTHNRQHSRVASSYSVKSIPETIRAVRELAGQFPGPPQPAKLRTSRPYQGDVPIFEENTPMPDTAASSESFGPPRLTMEEKGKLPMRGGNVMSKDFDVPLHKSSSSNDPSQEGTVDSLYPRAKGGNQPMVLPIGRPIRETLAMARLSRDDRVPNAESVATSPTNTPMTNFSLSGYMQTPRASTITPDTENPFLDLATALDASRGRQWTRNSTMARAVAWIGANNERSGKPMSELPSINMVEGNNNSTVPKTPTSANSMDPRKLVISWLKNPDVETEERKFNRGTSNGDKRPNLTRIKSVGKAPMRSTPAPVHTRHARGSLHIQPIMIPPKKAGATEIIQGSVGSTYSGGVLRDSNVLGVENIEYDVEGKAGYF